MEKKRQREKEQEDEEEKKQLKTSSSLENQEDFEEKIKKAETFIEQLNTLYHTFIYGNETIPPREKRKQLDQLMLHLDLMPKSHLNKKFLYQSLKSRYLSYSERWDRQLKTVEQRNLFKKKQ